MPKTVLLGKLPKMVTISVIIPIYNTMEYLDCCIKSVINQTFCDIEIICVDDCSTDDSKRIISEWMPRDKRINLVSLDKNSGLSAARNAGLDVASGKYVYFLDSDDWVDPHYLETMLMMAEKSGCQMVLNTNILGVYKNETKALWRTSLYDGEYWERVCTINKKYYNVFGWLFRRDFLTRNCLRFPEGYLFEDSYFYHLTLAYVDRIFAFQGPAYFYRQKRAGSIMATVNRNDAQLKISKLVLQFYRNNPNISCNGMVFLDNRIVLKLTSDEELRDFREFYKKNFPFFLQRDFCIDDYEKFLLKCLFASANLAELHERISQNKRFTLLESAMFFWIVLRNSKSAGQQKRLLFAKQLLWKSIKDYTNPYIAQDSKIRKAYRTLRNAIKRSRR